MQPLLITSLVALLIALIRLKTKNDELNQSNVMVEFWKSRTTEWLNASNKWRTKYDAQVNLVNKLQVDNALLVASLKKKHLRVPKL